MKLNNYIDTDAQMGTVIVVACLLQMWLP